MFRYILLASILILATATRESSAATTHTIAAITSSLTWSPSTISISVGDSILFTNLGDGTHIPVALKGAKTNCSSSNEDTTLWTPPSTGTQFLAGPFSSDMTFFFKCRPHCSSGMTGQITVGTGGATTKTSTVTTTKAASTSSAATTTKASTTTSSKTTTQGNSNGGSGGCFAADSSVRVRTASGAVLETNLAQVSRGDLVESFDAEGKQVFSRVYFVAHRNSPAQVPLLEFVLSGSASSLKLTANHLLLGTEGSFLPASAFKPGDLVWVRSQASTDLKPALIQSINKAVGPIRAALTLNDNIIVSEVAASVFVESQWLYQILAAPLKFFDAHFPSLLDENSLLTSFIDLLVEISDWIEAFLPHSTAAHSLALAAIRS